MFKKKLGFKLAIIGLILIAVSLRFFNLSWDQDHIYHPDERNISSAVARINFFKQLNPQFFAYNGLPIYLYRLTGEIVNRFSAEKTWVYSWEKINLISRYWSALFSSLTIGLIYLIAKAAFKTKSNSSFKAKKIGLLAAGLAVFCPSLIQMAHFGITESMLTFWISLIVYLSLRYFQKPQLRTLLTTALVCGLALATKTSAITFLIAPLMAWLAQSKPKEVKLWQPMVFLGLALIIFFSFSPYNFLSWSKYMESMNYEGGIVTGRLKVVYVLQFLKTIPYLFQFKNLIWQLGPVLASLSLIGLSLAWRQIYKTKNKLLLILLIWPSCYLLIVGSWYAKFVRYLVPILPFLCLTAAWLIIKLKARFKFLGKLLLILALITTSFWGLAFVNIYRQESSRITASRWLITNLPPGSQILSEHWDDGLPTALENYPHPDDLFTRKNLEIYEADNDYKASYLATELSQADYIVLASRRLWGTIINLSDKYPVTSQYYQLLFQEQLGYKKVQDISVYPSLLDITIPTSRAEETFQVYDHPRVIVFKNEARLSTDQIRQLLISDQKPLEKNYFNQLTWIGWLMVFSLLTWSVWLVLPKKTWADFLKFLKSSDPAKADKKIKPQTLVLLGLIILLAGFVRSLNLSKNPPGFFCDEAANGYNAYQLLTNGYDEHGKPWPLFFQSFGEYKNPIYIYSLIPFIKLLGLNEFSVRLLSAILGAATIVLFFLAIKNLFNQKIAIWSALVLAIMPWHIHFSRIGFQLISWPFIFCLGLYFYSLKKRSRIYLLLSYLCWGAGFYTYYAAKAFLPIFVLAIFISQIKKDKTHLLGLLLFVLVSLPAITFLFTSQGSQRWQATTIFKGQPVNQTLSAIIKNYSSYFSTSFLFSQGSNSFVSRHGVKNWGVIYWWQLPILIIGLISLLKSKLKKSEKFIWLFLLLTYPFPAILTTDNPSANRAILGVIPLAMFSGLGLNQLTSLIKKCWVKILILVSIFTFFGFYLWAYFYKYPLYSADYWGWQTGPKDIVNYFTQVESQFDQLIFSHHFNAPYIFLKFYAPGQCQNCLVGGLNYFDPNKDQLFALTPEEFETVNPQKIHQTIYYPNQEPAFYILEISELK